MSDLQNDIKKYLRGELSPAERHSLEKRALNDPFLADALEGAEQIDAEVFEADVDALSKEIQKVKKQSRWGWPLGIAAAIVVLLISTVAVWQVLQPVEQPETLALQKELPTPSLKDTAAVPTMEAPALKEEQPTATATSPSTQQTIKTKPIKPLTAGEEEKPVEQTVETAELAMEEVKKAEETSPAPVMLKPEDKVVTTYDSERAKKLSVAGAERKADTDKLTTVSKVIRGKVTSVEDGKGIPGVNVVIKGSTLGTVTDASGNYYITVKEPSPVLVYSFIGMESAEVTVAESTEVDVALEQDASQLSEVVVTGYGVSTRSEEGVVDLAHPAIGYRAYKQYLQQSMKYPVAAIENKIEGRVVVEFTVDSNGALSLFKVIKGIGAGCDDELIRLIQEGPSWIPTKRDGNPVQDKARVQLRFKLPK